MKKKCFLKLIPMFLGFGLMLFVISCKKDKPKPVADFTFTVTDLAVVFTDASTDCSTYAWDFGDTNTSTEQSPSHTYAAAGIYHVKLTVTGGGGTDDITMDVTVSAKKIQPILIDGKFADWDTVSNIYSFPDGEGRTLISAKLIDTKDTLYVFVKGTSSIGEVLQFFIDADNSPTTGWAYWNWYATPGIEYVMEAVVVGFPDGTLPGSVIKTYNAVVDAAGGWPWDDFVTADAMAKTSGYVTVGNNKEIEFALVKDVFTSPLFGNQIRVIFGNSDNTWSNVGTLPQNNSEPLTAPAVYKMRNY